MDDTQPKAPTVPTKTAQRGWYYALFFVLGMLAGVAATAAIIIPKVDEMAQTTHEQNTGVTLLYDPRALQCLAATGEVQQTYPNNSAIPYQGIPRWIIPGKVKPMVAGSSRDVIYSYFDPETQKYEGPFLPAVPQQRP